MLWNGTAFNFETVMDVRTPVTMPLRYIHTELSEINRLTTTNYKPA